MISPLYMHVNEMHQNEHFSECENGTHGKRQGCGNRARAAGWCTLVVLALTLSGT